MQQGFYLPADAHAATCLATFRSFPDRHEKPALTGR